MVETADIFNNKGLSMAEIEQAESLLALRRTPTQQLHFLTELIELSASLRNMGGIKKQPPVMTNLYQSVNDFFKKLNAHDVQYLLVGGFAVNAYGFARNTGDLDLWVNDTPENRKALGQACAAAGIAGGELLADMDWAPGWTGFHLANSFKVEIMGHLSFFTKNDFPACYEKAEKIQMDGTEVRVLHLHDLLKEKQATGRPKDLEDIEQLRKIDKERS
ncbi:MAG: hypothetical protein IPM82_15695 [Saprospiraceae bacterium]|nr:hypothetical protein [Saprospiraceae bacterium]